MWRVILATVCVIVLLGGAFFLTWGAGIKVGVRETEKKVVEKGGAGLRGAALLKRANVILDDLVHPKGIEPPAYITGDTRAAIEQWIKNYNNIK